MSPAFAALITGRGTSVFQNANLYRRQHLVYVVAVDFVCMGLAACSIGWDTERQGGAWNRPFCGSRGSARLFLSLHCTDGPAGTPFEGEVDRHPVRRVSGEIAARSCTEKKRQYRPRDIYRKESTRNILLYCYILAENASIYMRKAHSIAAKARKRDFP